MVCLKQKDSSTLSTNTVIEHVFSQGRRMWPLARESADPGGAPAWGVVLEGGTRGETFVEELS